MKEGLRSFMPSIRHAYYFCLNQTSVHKLLRYLELHHMQHTFAYILYITTSVYYENNVKIIYLLQASYTWCTRA